MSQASIMEQEAALESHASQIQAHAMHIPKYGLTEYEPSDPDDEFLEQEHTEFSKTGAGNQAFGKCTERPQNRRSALSMEHQRPTLARR